MSKPTPKAPLVLAVDDDVVTLQLACDMLTDEGFEVITAAGGDAALTLFRQASTENRPFDVVLLDVEMPALNGYQVCERIRALPNGSNIPIIMISGREDLEAAKRAYAVGATDFSSKPTNWLVLAQRLNYALRASDVFNELIRNQQRLADAQSTGKLHYWEYDIEAQRLYFLTPSGSLDALQKGQAQTLETLIKFTHPADRSALEAFVKTLTTRVSPISSSVEYRLLENKNGEPSRVLLTQGRVDFSNHVFGTAPKKLIGLTLDITDIRYNEERIQRLAHYDELTGLNNRQSFNEKLEVALELNKALQSKLAVFHLDLDNFQRINGSFGHQVGDKVICAQAERLKSTLNRCEVIDENFGHVSSARLGGDEFCLMFTCDEKDPKLYASRVAEQLKEALAATLYISSEENPSIKESLEITTATSIGIAMYPEDGKDAQSLLKNAETALHNAKNSGKNQYRFYNNAMSTAGRASLDLEAELRRAIELEQLELYYQPQVSTRTGELVGVEALVRWNHPQRGLVSPVEFIPLAEESGLILPMSDWIMHQACWQAKTWCDSGLPAFTLSINLSGMQFKQSDFQQRVQDTLTQTNVKPDLIGLELTESVVMNDAQATITALHALKQLGVKLSIDDFGTGYSSLSYLQKFPLDTLKVDRSFVMDIGKDSDDTAITEAIIAMGHSLGLQIIAEGVETQAQLDFLRERSCEVIQGYIYSKPLLASEIPAFAKTVQTL